MHVAHAAIETVEDELKKIGYIAVACIAALSVAPAFAADAMMAGPSMSMMKGGEVMAVMPDGHMGTMTVTDPKMMAAMMKMAKPMDHCMMMMTDAKGKTFMVDTSSKAAMAECEKMAK